MDETVVKLHGLRVYVWSAVALKLCSNKPMVIIDRGPWYRWALDRLGLEYEYQRFSMKSRVERFFRYLKERTMVFYHKLSARNNIQGIKNLNLYTIYYQTIKMESG